MALAFKADVSSLKYHRKALERFFEQAGVKRNDTRHVDPASETAYIERELTNTRAMLKPGWALPDNDLKRRLRTYLWLRDSLLWTIEELLVIERAADPERPYVFALRGLVQAAGYAGEVGHDIVTKDAYEAIKAIIERACEYASRGE